MGRYSSLRNPLPGLVKATLAVLLVAFLCGPLPLHAQWTLMDSVRVHPEYRGPVPKKSDVVFSTRFKRPEAPAAIKAFGATRIEWTYSDDPKFVQLLTSIVPWYGGAINATVVLPEEKGIARDLEGKPIIAPWMKSWGAKWITTTDPSTRRFLEDMARRYVELGASSIQVDDPLLQYAAANWGGDFSESSLAGFRRFLSTYDDQTKLHRVGIVDTTTFDYRKFLADAYGINTAEEYQRKYRSLPTTPLWLEYLKQSVISHFIEFRRFLNEKKGSVFPVSMNLLLFGPDESRPEFDLVAFADYAMVETKIEDLDIVSLQAATYRALGIGYVPSILPLTKPKNRTAIASLYAWGGQPVVPWDTYINNGPEQKPSRFFGAPEDYADLYRFVSKNKAHLDDHEELVVVGIVVPVNRYRLKQTLELVRRLSRAKVPYALVPVGGTKKNYPLNRKRTSHFRILLTVNPASDFSPDEQASLRSVDVRLLPADEVSDRMLASLSPYWGPMNTKTRLVARGAIVDAGRIIVHVIRPTEQDVDLSSKGCDQVLGLRRDAVAPNSVTSATWRSLKQVRKLRLTESAVGISVEIPDCEEWGMLELSVS
jgi:hypothetical protein